jgi:hypothetical protein
MYRENVKNYNVKSVPTIPLSPTREFQAPAAVNLKPSLVWELGLRRLTVSDPPRNYLEIPELFPVPEDDFIIPTKTQ